MLYNASSMIVEGNYMLDSSLTYPNDVPGIAKYHTEECEHKLYPYYDKNSSRLFHRMAILAPGLFGIAANVFVIMLAAKFTVRKNLHHLIINMALSDTIVIIVSSVYEVGLFNLSSKTETFLEFVMFAALAVSSVTLFIISIERFKVTWFAMNRRRRYSFKRCLAVILVTWVISISASLFRIIFDRYKESTIKTYLTIGYLACILLLFLMILILSSLTLLSLSRFQEFGNQLRDHARQASWTKIRNTVRMVQFSLLLYSICFLPFISLNIAIVLQGLRVIGNIDEAICIDWQMLRFIVAPFLPVINCSFSPFIYLICLPQLRKVAKDALCRCCEPPDD